MMFAAGGPSVSTRGSITIKVDEVNDQLGEQRSLVRDRDRELEKETVRGRELAERLERKSAENRRLAELLQDLRHQEDETLQRINDLVSGLGKAADLHRKLSSTLEASGDELDEEAHSKDSAKKG